MGIRRSALADEEGEHAGLIGDVNKAAVVRSAPAFAANASDLVELAPRGRLAEAGSHGHGLKKREVDQRARQTRFAKCVGDGLFMPESMGNIAFRVACQQNQAEIGDRLAVFPVEHANRDGLFVVHGKGLDGDQLCGSGEYGRKVEGRAESEKK